MPDDARHAVRGRKHGARGHQGGRHRAAAGRARPRDRRRDGRKRAEGVARFGTERRGRRRCRWWRRRSPAAPPPARSLAGASRRSARWARTSGAGAARSSRRSAPPCARPGAGAGGAALRLEEGIDAEIEPAKTLGRADDDDRMDDDDHMDAELGDGVARAAGARLWLVPLLRQALPALPVDFAEELPAARRLRARGGPCRGRAFEAQRCAAAEAGQEPAAGVLQVGGRRGGVPDAGAVAARRLGAPT